MNFLRDRRLQVLAFYVVAILSVIFIGQYLAIRYTLSELTEAERKIDFARSVQVQNQQIALQVEMLLQGKTSIAAAVSSRIDHQDYLLKTLGEGGRIENTDLFLDPLSRLPMITFINLQQAWTAHKTAIQTILESNGVIKQTEVDTLQNSVSDSTVIVPVAPVIRTVPTDDTMSRARLTFESQWLSISQWYDKLIADLEGEVSLKQSAVLMWFTVFMIANVAVLFLIYYLFRRHIIKPLKMIEENTARADFSNKIASNEIGGVATKVNAIIEDLRDATDFVISIREGNLDLDYKSLDASYANGKNKLADSLIEMQLKLKELNEEERKRQWVNEGLTRFVDILRATNDNLSKLGDRIIAALVQYTNSNQGALYILNDDDQNNKHLELLSLFAFDIKKHDQQKIRLGEGILGQTFLEKETTYITDVPASYIRITSGLGDAPPKSILIVPLKVDTQGYGILELASFHEYHPHEIGFVEKLGESIAATLASVRSTQKNRQLIEQFQQQTEEMRAQEEEMRQNMEELQATQEEIARKEKSYVERITELENLPAGSDSTVELQQLRAGLAEKEREYELKIEALGRELNRQPVPGDDWHLAREIETALRINLEALQITQEELEKKTKK